MSDDLRAVLGVGVAELLRDAFDVIFLIRSGTAMVMIIASCFLDRPVFAESASSAALLVSAFVNIFNKFMFTSPFFRSFTQFC